ncbi:hypothetical protein CCP4SC76_5720003 [Gammaproteobacteria bacterium]
MANRNDMFLELVKLGMTKEALETNIKRRPWIWKVYEGWLEVLPSESEKVHFGKGLSTNSQQPRGAESL